MSEKILNQLKEIIAEELDVNLTTEEIDENASLFEEGLGLDSVTVVELIALIEEKLGIQFSDAELNPDNFTTLRVLADFIQKK
jgi:acyl carrier protein